MNRRPLYLHVYRNVKPKGTHFQSPRPDCKPEGTTGVTGLVVGLTAGCRLAVAQGVLVSLGTSAALKAAAKTLNSPNLVDFLHSKHSSSYITIAAMFLNKQA